MKCDNCGSKHLYVKRDIANLSTSKFIKERHMCLDCFHEMPWSYKQVPIKVEGEEQDNGKV